MKNSIIYILTFLLCSCSSKPEFPDVNENELGPATKQQIALGRELFHDPILSSDNTISCAGCHESGLAFTDGDKFSRGVENRLGKRNSPTLINTAYLDKLNWDGGTNTIETQMLVPISDPNELNSSIPEIVFELNSNNYYRTRFEEVWNDSITAYTLTRSIGAFVRSLRSNNTAYDRNELNKEQKLGQKIFKKLECNNCHTPPLFTNQGFENNGIQSLPLDSGRARITFKDEDLERFKVPTLRNISLTAPYMHDGRFESLDEVIEHYSTGGVTTRNKSDLIQPFDISDKEKKALISFLKSLTDEELGI